MVLNFRFNLGLNKLRKEKILIVEDEIILALDLELQLQSDNFSKLKIVCSGEQAVSLARTFKPNIILMDIMLRGKMNGIEAAGQIRTFSNMPIIYITANNNLKNDPQLIATKPIAILGKPYPEWQLTEMIKKALKIIHE
jgi:two-component system, response regulator PdtaR